MRRQIHIQTDAEPRRYMNRQTNRVLKMSTDRYSDKVLKKTTNCHAVRQHVMSISQTSLLSQLTSQAHVGGVKSFGHSPYSKLGFAAELSEASD